MPIRNRAFPRKVNRMTSERTLSTNVLPGRVMRLNRPHDWDPVGESIWSVLHKLSHYNQLSGVDYRRLFGRSQEASFRDDRDLQANKPVIVPPEKIADLGGWVPSVFRYSTRESLYPPWPGRRHLDHQGWHRPARNRLRICVDCAEQGIHLALFQEHAWIGCPIHRAPLQDTCPHCAHPLPNFVLEPRHVVHVQCNNCQNPIWRVPENTGLDLQERKQTVFREYRAWMDRLTRQFTGEGARRRWLSGVCSPRQLKYAHACEPGPHWVEKSLANASDVHVNSHQWPHHLPLFERLGQADQEPHDALDDDGEANQYLPAMNLCTDVALGIHHIAHITDQWIKDRFRIRQAHDHGLTTMTSYHFSTTSHGGTSAWEAGYGLWRSLPWFADMALSASYPDDALITRKVFASALWRIWRQGHWSLLPGILRPEDRESLVRIITWISKIWVVDLLKHDYLRSVGLSLKNLDGSWMPRHGIFTELAQVSDPIDHLVTADSSGLQVQSFGCAAPISRFEQLCSANYAPTNAMYYEAFSRQQPVVTALAPHADDASEWYQEWLRKKRRWEQAA